MRILVFLFIITGIFACTSEKTETQKVVEQEQKTTPIKENNQDEITEEEVLEVNIPQEYDVPTSPKKVYVQENLLFSATGLDLLKDILNTINEVEDGIESFAAFEKSMEDTLRSMLENADSSILFTSSRGGNTKKGAFSEAIANNRTTERGAERVNKNSIEYMRRPKALIEDYTGYKIELMTVYNKSLALTDQLFKTFGGLTYRHKTEHSTTYYLGDFQNKKALEDYLNKVVLPRFPEAKGVKFNEGKVTKYK